MAKTKFKSYSEFAAVYGDIGVTEWVKYNYLAKYEPEPLVTKKYIIETTKTAAFLAATNYMSKIPPYMTNTKAGYAVQDVFYISAGGNLPKNTRMPTAVLGDERPYSGEFGYWTSEAEAKAVIDSISASYQSFFGVLELEEE